MSKLKDLEILTRQVYLNFEMSNGEVATRSLSTEQALADYGGLKVVSVSDPRYAASDGAQGDGEPQQQTGRNRRRRQDTSAAEDSRQPGVTDIVLKGQPKAAEEEQPAETKPEPTAEELLRRAKAAKLAAIDAYDKSDAVNQFTLGGQPMWLSVDERQQLATQTSVSQAAGRTEMTRWFGGNAFTFPLETWQQMLVALELYAGDALNVTEQHRAVVAAMDNVEEVEAYDHTKGYPECLAF